MQTNELVSRIVAKGCFPRIQSFARKLTRKLEESTPADADNERNMIRSNCDLQPGLS